MSRTIFGKQLRILSGTHAGASLDLEAGSHSLGAEPGADVSISDWRFESLELRITADGAVLAQWSEGAPQALRFDDFMPIDFAGVSLCFGPCDAAWPERPQLLANQRTATATPPPPARGPARIDRRIVSWVAVGLSAVVTVGWLASATSKPRDVAHPTLQSERAQLQLALETALGPRLRVEADHGALVVEGLVDDSSQALAAAKAIDSVDQSFAIVRRISVAADVKEAIRSAVDLPGARIDYRGGGVFALVARTEDVAATRAAVDRVATDLAPIVHRIDTVFDEPAAPQPPLPAVLSALVTDDGLNVMETRDGVKHLVMGAAAPYPPAERLSIDLPAGVSRQPGAQP